VLKVDTTKSMGIIENVYFSLNFTGNYNDWISKFLDNFTSDNTHSYDIDDYFIIDQVQVIGGIKRYPFGYKLKDMYRIYFASKTGDNYGVYIILSAMYLHTNNVWACMSSIQNTLENIIKYYDKDFVMDDSKIDFKLSRVDICNHNNFIDLDTYIDIKEFNKRTVTALRTVRPFIHLNGEDDQEMNYYRYGDGDVVVRFYNKIREVCEQQYKGFFIKKWFDDELIDKHTHDIYDFTYKLNNNYRTDFMFSNIIFSKVQDKIKEAATLVYNDIDLKHNEKYELFKKLLKKHTIILVHEVVNVEYQLRGSFFRTLKIDDLNGNIFDYTNLFSIILNIEPLYKYITHNVFRVIDTDSIAERKRDKKIDKLWVLIQESKIFNIGDYTIDDKKLKLYREYNTELSNVLTTKKLLKGAAHLMYIHSLEFNKDSIDDISILDLMENLYNVYNEILEADSLNENYFNIKDFLAKQIKYYGPKS